MGKHIWDAPGFFDPASGLYGLVTGTLSICAASWSKISFALTLLRITQGKLKAFVWFSIGVINLGLGAAALVLWIQCTPIRKAWDPLVAGTCWNVDVSVVVGIVGSGMYQTRVHVLPPCFCRASILTPCLPQHQRQRSICRRGRRELHQWRWYAGVGEP